MTRSSSLIPSLALAAACALIAAPAMAGDVEVVEARASMESETEHGASWRFDVTLRHADTGWEHYADRFEILTPEGEVLGTRVLAHPHVNEQPFTRSLAGVEIPKDLETVLIRGHDSVHGDSDPIELTLPR